jgi:hypothetical protein
LKGFDLTQSYTREEFVEYVKELEIDDLEQMVDLVLEYFDYYKKLPEESENKQLAWEKYVILISKYGVIFAEYSKMVLKFKKNLEMVRDQNENLEYESDVQSGSDQKD